MEASDIRGRVFTYGWWLTAEMGFPLERTAARYPQFQQLLSHFGVMMPGSFTRLTTGAEEHPCSEREDADGGADLRIRLDAFRIPLAAEIQRGRGEQPDDERVRNRRREAEQHGLCDGAANGEMNAAIIVLECPGSKPCKAPSRMAVGMKSQRLVLPLCTD